MTSHHHLPVFDLDIDLRQAELLKSPLRTLNDDIVRLNRDCHTSGDRNWQFSDSTNVLSFLLFTLSLRLINLTNQLTTQVLLLSLSTVHDTATGRDHHDTSPAHHYRNLA